MVVTTATEEYASPRALQEDMGLQEAVNRRLKAFLDKESDTDPDDEEDEPKPRRTRGKKKSGIKRTAADKVREEQDWPHLHVYSGPSRKPAEYEKLTQSEFVQGYISIIQECKSMATKELMLQHLKELTEDVADVGFEAVRSLHSVILMEMEQGRLKWADQAMFQKLRTTHYLHRKVHGNSRKKAQQEVPEAKKPCADWNGGQCLNNSADHTSTHICSYCMKHYSKKFHHKDMECRYQSASENY